MNANYKKRYFIGIAALIFLIAAAYFVWKVNFRNASAESHFEKAIDTAAKRPTDSTFDNNISEASLNDTSIILKQYPALTSQRNDSIPLNWKTYTNNDLGITFQYPDTWTKYGKESNSVNRNGMVMSILVNFTDTLSQCSFFIEYHLPPYGAQLYKYAQTQLKEGGFVKEVKQFIVAGNTAIESVSTMKSDIKGNVYDPPFRIVHVIFLDKRKTGEFDLRFKTPVPGSDKEVSKFKRILATIKFLN